tara:strand:- start:8 stop:202 length:195 start_codon:yes stop_codon:yes gene_type:complete
MIKDLKQLNKTKLTAKHSARIFSSQKKYLIKIEDDLYFTNNWQRYLIEKFPEVESNLVEIYNLK